MTFDLTYYANLMGEIASENARFGFSLEDKDYLGSLEHNYNAIKLCLKAHRHLLSKYNGVWGGTWEKRANLFKRDEIKSNKKIIENLFEKRVSTIEQMAGATA